MTTIIYCKNCNHPIDNKFCPSCGQTTSTKKFSFRQIGHHFLHGFLHLEHGILFTIKELCINPGRMIKDYLFGKRIKYFNPFTFILLLGSLSVIVFSKIHFQSFAVELGVIDESYISKRSWEFSIKHFSYRILLGIPLYALISRIFYLRKDFNYPEHLIANTYLRGMADVVLIIGGISGLLVHSGRVSVLIKFIAIAIIISYYAWAYAVLFNNRVSFKSLAKGALCAVCSLALEIALVNMIALKALRI